MIDPQRLAAALGIAAALAIPAEGLRQYAYRDPPGILTVCRGHTGRDIDPARLYPIAECDALLDKDMRAAIATVERCAPGLPDHALAAFGDAVYNLGPRIVCDRATSTAARLLAAGRLAEACEQLPRWNKTIMAGVAIELPGLTARREAERRVCLGLPLRAATADR